MIIPDVFWITLPPTIAALGGLIVGIRTSRTVKEVAVQTNHNWEALQVELKDARREITELRDAATALGIKTASDVAAASVKTAADVAAAELRDPSVKKKTR